MRKLLFLLALLLTNSLAYADVKVVRVPEGGIEPQAVVDGAGVIHLIYFKGAEGGGDVFYTTSADGGDTFKPAVRVNSQPGSAMVTGSVRGAHLALGRDGRIHVAWMGSFTAEPKAPDKGTPFLYAHRTGDGKFTPQRNVISAQPGLDGGGSIVADDAGHVYIAWHAPLKKGDSEQGRLVWVTKSADDGTTFAPEFAIRSLVPIGACGCCSLQIAVGPGGELAGLFRQADQKVNRGTNFFTTNSAVTKTETVKLIAPMHSGVCLMSNNSLIPRSNAWLAGYETSGEVFFQILSRSGEQSIASRSAGRGKFPAMAINSKDQVLIARAVGTGWKKGGTIAWQEFNLNAEPLPETAGTAPGLEAWSYPTAVALADGSFVIFY